MEDEKIKIALVRGDSLNVWEGGLWENLGSDFAVTGIGSRKNLYDCSGLRLPRVSLSCTTDNFLLGNLEKISLGHYQRMSGLEKELERHDIAHTAELYFYYTLQAVRAKKRNPRLKVVTTVWDNSFGRFEHSHLAGRKALPDWWRGKMDAIMKEAAAGVDLFLPVSEYSAGLLESYDVPAAKIRILAPGVRDVDDSEADLDLKIAEEIIDKEVYMVVNRLVEEKGVYDILYAWKRHLNGVAGRKILLIVGSGPEAKNLKRLAEKLALADSVRFVSHLSNDAVHQLFKRAKCLILASLPTPVWQEQFGFVLAEAIKNCCPVIGADSGAIPEVIGTAGLIFTPGHPIRLAERLSELDDPGVRDELKQKCLDRSAAYSTKRFRRELAEIYREVIGL